MQDILIDTNEASYNVSEVFCTYRPLLNDIYFKIFIEFYSNIFFL